MSKGERRRTLVYSNVNKKADSKSALRNKNVIDLDDEIIIGLPNNNKSNKNSKSKKVDQVKNKKEKKTNKVAVEKNEKTEKNVNKAKTKKDINKNNVPNQQIPKEDKLKMQKRRAIKKIGVFGFLLFLIIGGLVYFLLSPVFNIKSIEVLNNKHVPSQEIIAASKMQVGQNMFKYSKKDTKNSIIANSYIDNVSIKRNMITKSVKIIVTERTPSLMLEYGNSFVYMDNQGYFLEISQQKINVPIIKGYKTPLEDIKPGKRLVKDDLEKLETVLNIIKNAEAKDIANLITYIDIKDKKNYCMFLETEDKTVYLGKCSDLSTQMLYIKEMIEREKNIEGSFYVNMDLNVSNPVFKETV